MLAPGQPRLSGLGACTRCPRLAAFLSENRARHPDYFCRPVPPFGDTTPRLLVVGLAPGLHGANRTGRPFTGDYAGELLYDALHRFGWSTGPRSLHAEDGLRLAGCRITNAVKCVPPANKPVSAEIRNCNSWLTQELAALMPGAAILALGRIAHDAVLLGLGLKPSAASFAHGARASLPGALTLFDSYHCSRYNLNTRRLSPEMFLAVLEGVQQHLTRPAVIP